MHLCQPCWGQLEQSSLSALGDKSSNAAASCKHWKRKLHKYYRLTSFLSSCVPSSLFWLPTHNSYKCPAGACSSALWAYIWSHKLGCTWYTLFSWLSNDSSIQYWKKIPICNPCRRFCFWVSLLVHHLSSMFLLELLSALAGSNNYCYFY